MPASPHRKHGDFKRLGTRHRAGVGLTEETDAVAIVVSEETGTISTGIKGVLTQGNRCKRVKKDS